MGSLGLREDDLVVNQVSIGGFDETVSARELADFLEQEVGLLWRCRVKTQWTPPESYPDFDVDPSVNSQTQWTDNYEKAAPHAFVHFVVSSSAARALEAAKDSGLLLHGRRLVVRSLADSSLLMRRRRTVDPFKIPAIDFQMGSLICGADDLMVYWSGPKSGVDFLVDPFDNRGRILFSRDVVFSLKGRKEKALLKCDLKMEFSIRDIVELRFYSDSSSIVLLLLLASVPFMFYRVADDDVFCSEPVNLLDDDDPWVRTTDFTGSAAGCYSCYRFSLSPRYGAKLKKLKSYLCEQGVAVKDLAAELAVHRPPRPPQEADVFFAIPPVVGIGFRAMFMVNALIHKGVLNPLQLSPELFSLIKDDDRAAEAALCHLYYSKRPLTDPNSKLRLVLDWQRWNSRPTGDIGSNHVEVRRLVITPAKAYCLPPAAEVSNRVLRQYAAIADRFLRVTFTDEGMQRLNIGTLAFFPAAILGDLVKTAGPRKSAIFRRVRQILEKGFLLCGRRYHFLAFSANQLRDRSAWFFAQEGALTVDSIRAWMGSFPNRNVAKLAARMGQCFSSTVATVELPPTAVDPFLKDIKRNDYVFSDGIGKVSPDLALKVAAHLHLRYDPPSAYQIRFGGCKGVIAVWPSSGSNTDSGPKLFLRPSMKKFETGHSVIEVASWTRPQPGFLNRQIVTLLSCLGVGDDVFAAMQEEHLRRLDEMVVEAGTAAEMVAASCGDGGAVPGLMLGAGFRPETEPHLRGMLACIRSAQLRDLMKKTRIFVPGGRWLMGCLDELGVLDQGQCFVQVSSPSLERAFFSQHGRRFEVGTQPQRRVVTGTVAIAKNPCLHPGDVRILEAVNVPELHHLVDCLVFPQRGERPHCNEASGSDLDGDLYFVTWEEQLLPPGRRSFPPMDYQPDKPSDAPRRIDPKDVVEFFMKSMINENLGQICHAHVVQADRSPFGAADAQCLKLAELAAQAVDFPKTGKAVKMPRELRPKLYPDFMEKPPYLTYQSEKILGRLYRQMRSFLSNDHCEKDLLSGDDSSSASPPTYDSDLELPGTTELLPAAWQAKCAYDARLASLLAQYSVAHEEELVVGHVWSLPKSLDSRRERETKERLKNVYASLRREFRQVFEDLGPQEGKEEDDEDKGEAYEAKASAWYQVAYHPDWVERARQRREIGGGTTRANLSFPWIAVDYLARIKVRRRRDRGELDEKKPEDALAKYLSTRL
ncbi:RNA-dependent RNA polymerase 6 [Wolffia australiana]